MVRYEDECVGCPPHMGCLGAGCRYKHVPYYFCDDCGEQDTLYEFDGEELCIECIKKQLDVVEGSEL